MKVERIGNAYFNEFEGMAQSCWNECAEYRGKTSMINTLIRNAGFKGDGTDKEKEMLEKAFGSYCCKERSPKTSMFW
ncbi:MAG: hypothetical protein IKV85_04125 [Ruminococcus sp.]|nr:hypothetical protein [Ruminococcus sp.]